MGSFLSIEFKEMFTLCYVSIWWIHGSWGSEVRLADANRIILMISKWLWPDYRAHKHKYENLFRDDAAR